MYHLLHYKNVDYEDISFQNSYFIYVDIFYISCRIKFVMAT